MKIEIGIWHGRPIRLVEVNSKWWAVVKDIAEALDYGETYAMTKKISKDFLISAVLAGMNAKSTVS